jgi:hypothetical protein
MGIQQTFFGKAPQGTVSITDQLIASSATPPTIPQVTAGYTLLSSGQAQRRTGATGSPFYINIAGEWLISGLSTDFDVMATLVSGTSPSGSAVGSWLNLGTSREWRLTSGAAGTLFNCVLTVQIRNAVTLAVLDTATIEIEASNL